VTVHRRMAEIRPRRASVRGMVIVLFVD